MIGARHAAGSTISNGGDSSPLNRVIVGCRPCKPLNWTHHFCQKNGAFMMRIVDNRNRSAKRKKSETLWNVSRIRKNARLHCVGPHSGPEMAPQSADRAPRSFTRNLPSVGLSERIDPLDGIRRPTAMHKILLA